MLRALSTFVCVSVVFFALQDWQMQARFTLLKQAGLVVLDLIVIVLACVVLCTCWRAYPMVKAVRSKLAKQQDESQAKQQDESRSGTPPLRPSISRFAPQYLDLRPSISRFSLPHFLGDELVSVTTCFLTYKYRNNGNFVQTDKVGLQ